MQVEQIFNRLKHLKVGIVGDVMVDAYKLGKSNRISPEAPVPIVEIYENQYRAGGAANVATNISALQAQPLLFSVIGNDATGQILINLLKDFSIETNYLLVDNSRPTTLKTRIMSGNQQLLRIDEETTQNISASSQALLLATIEQNIGNIDVMVFQDYDKGVLTAQFISQVIALCKQYKVPTVVDPKRSNFLHYHGVDLFKPNFKELTEGLDAPVQDKSIDELNKASIKLKSIIDCGQVLITLSEKGVYYNNFISEAKIIPAHLRAVADVSGAGDTLISVAALCLGLGLEMRITAELSNIAGGLVCEQMGVVPINFNQLLTEAKAFLA